jgi:hypothetical protein
VAGRIQIRRRRSQVRRKWRVHKGVWRDPFPLISGTKPEKMLFAALRLTGHYFVFQDTLEEWKGGSFSTINPPDFIPDFVLPQWKVIIDPFGDYHHLLPEAVERDAYKAGVYASMGYAFYHPWASHVEASGGMAILREITEIWKPAPYPLPAREEPYLFQGYRLGPYVGIGSKSVAAVNRRRRRWKIGYAVRR